MRERVAALKGQLALDASPGKGTQITVRIPLAAEAPASSALETT
jgi:signal transduction histidine kinase